MSANSLARLVRAVGEVKRDDPLAPVTVIVPSNLSARTLGWHLAKGTGHGRRGIAGIRITTAARLAESIAAIHLQPRQPLTSSILAAAWRSELERNASAQHWEFAEVWDHPATVSALVRTYRDLRETNLEELPLTQLGQVTSEAIRLASRVRDTLSPDWYDQQDLFEKASNLITSIPDHLTEFGSFIRYLAGDEPGSSEAFLTTLESVLPVTTIDDDGPAFAQRVIHSSDSDDEARNVVREVSIALSEGQEARRLAILYTRPEPYARIIDAHLGAAGITHNGRGGIPVAEMASARAFLGILDLFNRKFPRAGLFHVLSDWPVRQMGTGNLVPTVAWERTSREANVAGGEAVETSWVRRLDDFISQQTKQAEDATGGRLRRIEWSIKSAEELRCFVTSLDAQLTELDASETWEETSRRCLQLLAELCGDVDDIKQWEGDEKRAFVTLRAALASLPSLDSYRHPNGIKDLLDVLQAQLEDAVPRAGKFGRGVFVGPVAQARGLDLDQVWVVGLSEDMFPGRQSEDALLPDWLRAQVDGLVSAHERVQRAAGHLQAAFASASKVTACFPRGDLRGNTQRLPSQLLLPSLRRLVGDASLSATRWQSAPHVASVLDCSSFASGIRSDALSASDQEWAMRRALEVGDSLDEPAFLAARTLRRNRAGEEFTRFDGNLSGLPGLPNFAAGERRISPTALESYARCPFAYFVKRLLYVEPVQEPTSLDQASPMTVGNIFHYAMDRFINAEKEAGRLPGPGQPWDTEQHARFETIADEVIAEFETRGLLGHPTLWSFLEPQVKADIRSILTGDSNWRATIGAQPVASELAFGFGEDRPAEITVEGGKVLFVGSADKVDVAGDTVYVTDIKSGNIDPFKKITSKRPGPNVTVDGTKLQLPVYARAALQAHPGATVASAQYWFVHGKSANKRIELPLSEEVETTFSRVVGTLVTGIAAGHFFKKPSKNPGYLWVDCEFCTPGGAGHDTARNGYTAKAKHPELRSLLDVIDPQTAADFRNDTTPVEEQSQ